jgi:AcrR family transcriptional regulator
MSVSEPPRPLRKDAERNRLRILEAARELFAERGLQATLDDVAHRAGVGVGTVYRRFPDKDQLVEALFESRLDQMSALARESLEDEDAWRGLVSFLQGVLSLQAEDRGLKEVALGGPRGQSHVAAARQRIAPLVAQLVARAKQQGALRPDVEVSDMPLLQLMIGTIVDCSREIDPELWRRFLAIVLDGLRARDGVEPLPVEALSMEQVAVAMTSWRPPRT